MFEGIWKIKDNLCILVLFNSCFVLCFFYVYFIKLVVRGGVGRFCLVGGGVRFDLIKPGHPPI